MKGQNTFTAAQIESIKALINEKVRASQADQKTIREKIRKLGFYYSDFDSSRKGYTVSDLENLIVSGRIQVIN